MVHVFVYYLLPFISLMAALIAVHEGAHFAAARLLGIHTTHFSIGFGPALAAWRDRRGCLWRIGLLPLGGYVRMLGDADPSGMLTATDYVATLPEAERSKVYALRPPLHRMAVVAAGPAANLILGFLIIWSVYCLHGVAVTEPSLSRIVPDSPAAAAGLVPGDRIVAVDGKAVDTFDEVFQAVAASDGHSLALAIRHDGAVRTVDVAPRMTTVGNNQAWRLGIAAGPSKVVKLSPGVAAARGVRDTWAATGRILHSLRDIATRKEPLKNVGGPVRMAEVSGDVLATYGLIPFAMLAALLSVNLGVVNLLPLPVLDGGHLVLFTIELVCGRPVNQRVTTLIFRGGVIALAVLFAAITGGDVAALLERLVSS